jgi:hypothetical protein
MKNLKGIANIVRGWFPVEPKLSRPVQQLVHPYMKNQVFNRQKFLKKSSPTKWRITALIYSSIIFIFCAVLAPSYFKAAWPIEAVLIAIGLVAGLLVSLPLTERAVRLLSQVQGTKTVYLEPEVLPWLVTTIITVIFLYISNLMQYVVFALFVSAAFMLGYKFTNFALVLRLEKTSKKTVYEDDLGRALLTTKNS